MNEIVPADTHTELVSLADRATSLVIKCLEDANHAANMRGASKILQKKIKDFFAPHKKAADELHSNLCASEKNELDPLREVDSIIDAKLRFWDSEQEQARALEQSRIDKEAQKQAEDALIAMAEQEIENGNTEAAKAILESPVVVTAAPVVKEKVSGVSMRDNWKGDVTDLKSLVMAVAQGLAPISLVCADTSSINKFAKATKGSIQMPGVRFYSEKVIAQR